MTKHPRDLLRISKILKWENAVEHIYKCRMNTVYSINQVYLIVRQTHKNDTRIMEFRGAIQDHQALSLVYKNPN